MPAKKKCVVRVETLKHSGVLYGPVRVLHGLVKSTASAYMYDHVLHAYKVPLRDLDRVLCAVERAGHRVDMPMLAGWS